MEKEGLSSLEYSLMHEAEIDRALEAAAQKTWQELHSLDSLVVEELPDGVEMEDTPVYQRGNEAMYRVSSAELPDNYHAASYRQQEIDAKDVSYSFTLSPGAVMWEAPAEAYERQLDLKAHTDIMRNSHVEIYPTAEIAGRVENYKISLGFAMRCLLYTIKTASI